MFPRCESDEECSEEEVCNPRTKTCENSRRLDIDAKGRSGQFGHSPNMDTKSRHVEYQDLDEDEKKRAKQLYEHLMQYVNSKSQKWEKEDARERRMTYYKQFNRGDILVKAYEKYLGTLNTSKSL